MFANFRRPRFAAAFAGVILLAGCGYQPIGTIDRPEYRVQAAQGQYDLRFVPGAAALEPGEEARLTAFLEGLALRNWDEVLLTFGPSGSAELDGARVVAASRAVAEAAPVRVNVVNTLSTNQLNPYADVVFVQALRSGQLLVACPSRYLDEYEQTYASRIPSMTCSNAANLAFMAADRGDLVRPRALGPSDGTTSSAAVIRYRTNTIKQPAPVGTSSTQ